MSLKQKIDHHKIKLHTLKIQNNYLRISSDLKIVKVTHTETERRLSHKIIFFVPYF